MPAQLNLHLLFNRGEAYSSGGSEKQKKQKLCALCGSAVNKFL